MRASRVRASRVRALQEMSASHPAIVIGQVCDRESSLPLHALLEALGAVAANTGTCWPPQEAQRDQPTKAHTKRPANESSMDYYTRSRLQNIKHKEMRGRGDKETSQGLFNW